MVTYDNNLLQQQYQTPYFKNAQLIRTYCILLNKDFLSLQGGNIGTVHW